MRQAGAEPIPDVGSNPWIRSILAAALAAGLIVAFVTPYCGVLFHCGCRLLWAGGAEHCNINNDVPPYCPFCNHGTVGAGFVRISMFGSEALAIGLAVRRNWSYVRLTILVLIVFLLSGAAAASLFAWNDGYCAPFSPCWWQYFSM
jgi:hypothetical protein